MGVSIIKASGKTEKFSLKKLADSLMRSGAARDMAYEIARQVRKQVKPLTPSKDIYRMARKLLRKHNRSSVMKYSLKKALFSLGPSGYPFEQYFARILSTYGYSVQVGRIVDGYCVQHEVDVIAQNEKEHIFIECKYHSRSGSATDVKTALYIHARFLDIKKAYEKIIKNTSVAIKCWLATNTRCTHDAMAYAECSDLGIVSWRYPEELSLEKLIEDKKLYPVTILPAARKGSLEILLKKDFVLAQDIADMDEKSFLRNSGLDHRIATQLKKQADELCPCIR